MARDYPAAHLRVVVGKPSHAIANPKIAWQRLLAPEAAGELWLWSDADIVAPPDFLRRARAEYLQAQAAGVEMITFPYTVTEVPTIPALLEALFINVEFHPGVLFLRRLGEWDFGLGAAMLFSRDVFERRVDWDRLGTALADDFDLGQALRPVRLGAATLSAVLDPSNAKDAMTRYLRWQKTIRWCRPIGFAGMVSGMPVLGWLGAAVLHPGNVFPWLGLALTIGAEGVFASLLCRAAGCRWRLEYIPVAAAWSVLRPLVWAACWLPWPVIWRDRRWWSARSAPEPLLAVGHTH
jgi:ceramide glucosyltransferase